MPSWAWLAAIAATALGVVAVIALRRRWDMAAGAATSRANRAEADLQRLRQQAAIVAEDRTVDDASKRLRHHDF